MKNRFRFNKGNNVIMTTLANLMTVCIAVSDAYAVYPDRPITIVSPWDAGGCDTLGHSALATAKPDGYTIGTINVDLSQSVCKGLTDLSYGFKERSAPLPGQLDIPSISLGHQAFVR